MMKLKLFQKSSKNALEKRFTTFVEQLGDAFGKVRKDIDETHSRIDLTHKEIERLNSWIGYLNIQNAELSSQNESLNKKYVQISEKHKDIDNSHNQLISETEKVSRVLQDHQESLKSHRSEVSGILEAHKDELRMALSSHENLTKDEIERLKGWIDYFTSSIERQKSKEETLEAELDSLRGLLSQESQTSENTIKSLRSENMSLKTSLESVSEELKKVRSGLHETQDELKNTQKNIENLRNIAESESKSELQPQILPQQPVIQSEMVQQQVQMPQNLPSQAFERHIMSRVMPNRKGYIMSYIMELVEEGRYSTKEIEEMVVKEKNLCGRTSFYAYLKEMKYRGKIGYAEIGGRSMLVNMQQTHND